ncbi:PQQ-dependent sugar dehydrogenase [Sandaracinomonas limnophila]|uniref:PQQ-dependent sugar dehydrogenase n=1 Tax=Sandaracinomonas limnophila TaxID=1862386 RepID=A0A437PR97_9BACT|nr:PQQ-dependent sugar dehydrogenase [Sandaracinomonas limnophila]RVU24766.1 PQQ-dependent sugar dehydrogenase [Sandaracinomonas limnophila]
MKKYILPSLAIFGISLGTMSLTSIEKEIQIDEKQALKNYSQYCASCHGEKVEAFVDRNWKHGKTKSDFVNSITKGYPDLGMPTWGEILSKEEINDLAELINKNLATVDQYKFANKPSSNIFKSEDITVQLDTIATGFESPWGFVQLPDLSYLITDRKGVLYHVDQHKNKTEIKGIPAVMAKGQGGLLDIELHPQFEKNGWIYLSYSKFKEENGTTVTATAIVRGKIKNNQWVEQEELFVSQPFTKTFHHFGSRITFDKKGLLYFSVGERGMEKDFPQFTNNDNGKIHRLNDDGSIPKDNPFVGKDPKEFHHSIYSYGQRNPQGLTTNPWTGDIWETEHGPRGGDEINIIKAGKNYGWPTITYGINYDGKPISNISKKEGMEQPITYYLPSIAPSGLTFVTGDKYPAWKGNLLIGSLRFNYLQRVEIKDNKVVNQEKVLLNIGRMRNVEMGRDGYIYVGVENPGMVFKLVIK